MTVIAYDKKLKLMGSDSLCSNGGFYSNTVKKIYRTTAGALIGTSGDAECRNARHLFDGISSAGQLPSTLEIAATKNEIMWLLVLPDETVWDIWNLYDEWRHESDAWYAGVQELKDRFAATGHGMDFALAALESGATMEQAIKLACKHSLFCRPPVQLAHLFDEEIPRKKTSKKKTEATPVVVSSNNS